MPPRWVVTADLRVPPDFIVEGRLRRFEQTIGPTAFVRVEMDLGVVRLRGEKLLQLTTYRADKPTTGDRPGDAIAAYRDAVADIFQRFIADLAQKPVLR